MKSTGQLRRSALALLLILLLTAPALAAEVILAHEGKSAYQIVIPDGPPAVPGAVLSSIPGGIIQVARLIQAAFKSNHAILPIVHEHDRDPAKPAIFLGDTAFARANGFDPKLLKSWGYQLKVVGNDVMIAGKDTLAPNFGKAMPTGSQYWDRLGTAKGAADFLRQYVGTRFLFPDLAPRTPIFSPGNIDWLTSPGIEFLRVTTVTLPSDLDIRQSPTIEFNTSYPPSSAFYDIANNRYPPVDMAVGGHTYPRAIPAEKYAAKHPEYFVLVNGERATDVPHYCISNQAVQDLIFQDMLDSADRGNQTVDLGQGDGFRACGCKECANLYDTGNDWSEKLWLFHKKLAERFLEARPGKFVAMLSYSTTETLPKTFKKFPANTRVVLCGSNEEDFAKWNGYEVPGGFMVSVYNWTPNLGTRYTPMRTPRYVEAQAKRFAKYHVQSIHRDGTGMLFGLEGPVYYTMGRMYDNPEKLQAKDLVPEFCNAAFGVSAPPMLRFYDQLYHSIELYSGFLGTRSPAWAYISIDGQGRKYATDPFAMMPFLYPVPLLASLDRELTLAEKTADTDKIKIRLALVRKEFEYVRALVRVMHLFNAYQIQPDRPSRDRVLDAIDARNAMIDGYYESKPRPTTGPATDWPFPIFPPPGHTPRHLRLSVDGYQEPYARTPINWNTTTMRDAPLPGEKPAPGSPSREPQLFEKAPPAPVNDLDEPMKKR